MNFLCLSLTLGSLPPLAVRLRPNGLR